MSIFPVFQRHGIVDDNTRFHTRCLPIFFRTTESVFLSVFVFFVMSITFGSLQIDYLPTAQMQKARIVQVENLHEVMHNVTSHQRHKGGFLVADMSNVLSSVDRGALKIAAENFVLFSRGSQGAACGRTCTSLHTHRGGASDCRASWRSLLSLVCSQPRCTSKTPNIC